MPYITQGRRDVLHDNARESGTDVVADNAGELNYLFTELCQNYLHEKGLNYQHLNDCIGALEGAKQELYRRVAAPYEDGKAEANGDVYYYSLRKEQS